MIIHNRIINTSGETECACWSKPLFLDGAFLIWNIVVPSIMFTLCCCFPLSFSFLPTASLQEAFLAGFWMKGFGCCLLGHQAPGTLEDCLIVFWTSLQQPKPFVQKPAKNVSWSKAVGKKLKDKGKQQHKVNMIDGTTMFQIKNALSRNRGLGSTKFLGIRRSSLESATTWSRRRRLRFVFLITSPETGSSLDSKMELELPKSDFQPGRASITSHDSRLTSDE